MSATATNEKGDEKKLYNCALIAAILSILTGNMLAFLGIGGCLFIASKKWDKERLGKRFSRGFLVSAALGGVLGVAVYFYLGFVQGLGNLVFSSTYFSGKDLLWTILAIIALALSVYMCVLIFHIIQYFWPVRDQEPLIANEPESHSAPMGDLPHP